MAVAGERVERHIGDNADVRHRLLDGARRGVDEVVGLKRVGTRFITQFHLDVREGRNGRNAEIGSLANGLDSHIHAHAVDARHGGDGITDVAARNQKDRPDEIINGQAAFLNHASRPVRLAVAAHAAVSGDVIDEMGLVMHGLASWLAFLKRAAQLCARFRGGDTL